MTEIWLAGAAVLLGIAALARAFSLFRTQARWKQIAMWARVAAAPLMLAALIWASDLQALWLTLPAPVPLHDFRLAAVGLALAALVTYLVLVWWLRSDAASPVIDLLVLGLVLAGLFWRRPVGGVPVHAASLVPVLAQRFLFQLGAGGALVAGGAGLTLAARSGTVGRAWALAWAPWIDIHVLLKQATAWALISLGAGLTLSIWWAWRILGRFASDGVQVEWIAVVWLIAGMSMLARRTGNRGLRWTASLAIVAALVVVLGMLA
jgi:hypothetical protein